MDCDSERIWKIVESNRQNIPKKRKLLDSHPTLFDKFHDLYVENTCDKFEKSHRFKSAVNIVKAVDSSIAEPSLLLNLYHDGSGYSIILCPDNGDDDGEIFLPYEENYIFDYLDNQQIPPILLEILQRTEFYHSHGGCILCEVRNYQTCSKVHFDSYILLLHPTSEIFLSAINGASQKNDYTGEEELVLESQLLLATQSPICLDPSTDVTCVTNRLSYNQRKFNSLSVKRYLHQRSHAARAQKKLSINALPAGLKVFNFLREKNINHSCNRRKFSGSWKSSRKRFIQSDIIEQLGYYVDWVEGNQANIDFKLEQLHEANDLYRAADIVAYEDISRLARHIPSISVTLQEKSRTSNSIMELQLTKDINQPNLTTSEVITLHDPLTPHSTQPFLVSMVNNTQPSSSESVIEAKNELCDGSISSGIKPTHDILPRVRVTPLLNPQPRVHNRSMKKSIPPLTVWHPSKPSVQSKLPKLHPLMSEQKTQQSILQSIPSNKMIVNQCGSGTLTMPQLHKMPIASNKVFGSGSSRASSLHKMTKQITRLTESEESNIKSSKNTSETLDQLVQAHIRLAQSQAELSSPKS